MMHVLESPKFRALFILAAGVHSFSCLRRGGVLGSSERECGLAISVVPLGLRLRALCWRHWKTWLNGILDGTHVPWNHGYYDLKWFLNAAHKLQEIHFSLTLSHCPAVLASRSAVRYCVTNPSTVTEKVRKQPHRSGVRFEYENVHNCALKHD